MAAIELIAGCAVGSLAEAGFDSQIQQFNPRHNAVARAAVREDEQVGCCLSRDLINKVALHVEQGSAGLPVGVQVVARPGREHVALAAMSVIEQEVRNAADGRSAVF